MIHGTVDCDGQDHCLYVCDLVETCDSVDHKLDQTNDLKT